MTEPQQDDGRLLELYRRMVLTRRLDERLAELVRDGLIHGPMHLGIGQEATGIGATAPLRPGDVTTATHRPHAQYVGLGLPLGPTIAEMMGRRSGQCRGRAGHMLVADRAHGLLGPSGIVGHSLLLATGHGYAQRVAGRAEVTLCMTGDGAVNSGAFNEAMNMISLWRLPVIVLVENNQYALSVRLDRHVHERALFHRAAGYGVPGRRVDGNDVTAVYDAVAAAVGQARDGGGPTLIEAVTYRNTAFSGSDRGGYQDDSERHAFTDPLVLAEHRLVARGVPRAELARLHTTVDRELAEAVEFARASPWPSPDDVLDFAARWDRAGSPA